MKVNYLQTKNNDLRLFPLYKRKRKKLTNECVPLPSIGAIGQLWLASKTLSATQVTYGEGNGTPLQHSCLENPVDGGAW